MLSTCNRTEIYAVTEKFHGAYADIRDFLCDLGDISADELHPHLFSQHDDAAVAHLFEVAAGLDSAVVGESEILGQLRQAWEVAQREGGARSTLNLLFRHAVEVGKRARTETAIARGTASVSHAAVEMAVEHHGSISGRPVALVGAGAMGEGIAVALHGAGVGDVMVVNRSPERGAGAGRAHQRPGTRHGSALRRALESSDVVLTSTGSGEPLITADLVRGLDRGGRPLLFVDIAVPRDVAADVADVPTRDRARPRRPERAGPTAVAPSVWPKSTASPRSSARKSSASSSQSAALQAAPLVSSLRERAEAMRMAELGTARQATRAARRRSARDDRR